MNLCIFTSHDFSFIFHTTVQLQTNKRHLIKIDFFDITNGGITNITINDNRDVYPSIGVVSFRRTIDFRIIVLVGIPNRFLFGNQNSQINLILLIYTPSDEFCHHEYLLEPGYQQNLCEI